MSDSFPLPLLFLSAVLCFACGVEGPAPAKNRAPDEARRVEEGDDAPPFVADRVAAPSPAETPAVDLLHAVPTTLAVSSVYHDEIAQVAELVDGDLDSAWNSRTGDLAGAWIEVVIPEGATVDEIALTVGFPRVRGDHDLFTGNHRVAEVLVSRDGTPLGRHALDVESRDLQRIPVDGGAGRYRVTVIRVVEGSRPDWRETCVSELRVMGRAPQAVAGSQTPTLLVGPSASAVVTDAAYFSVRGRGLVRLSSVGVELLLEPPIVDFAVSAEGRVFVLVPSPRVVDYVADRLIEIADGQRNELAVPDNEIFESLALDPSGEPVLAGAYGIWRRRGRGWYPRDVMDDAEDVWTAQQPQAIVVGPDGVAWARGQHSLFRGERGRYDLELSEIAGSNVSDMAAGGTVVAASGGGGLCILRSSWVCSRPGVDRVTVGADGTVVAGGHRQVLFVPPVGEPVTVALPDADDVMDLARDARGRTWIASTGGLWVLGPDQAVLRHWPGVPGLGGEVRQLRLAGRGPELPAAP